MELGQLHCSEANKTDIPSDFLFASQYQLTTKAKNKGQYFGYSCLSVHTSKLDLLASLRSEGWGAKRVQP
ncbi:hypothetical protein GCM10011383_08750 [Hymenobacter cavernae]|uniref:Uncharacterized protein n=1 Tax=Hymenobacter cavernae TaxID=2044852 RepID=A0ABQ1TRI1_9BACT|nr:hypothetical protein GCM10011383_08750 [Hymenobacter cavernae]